MRSFLISPLAAAAVLSLWGLWQHSLTTQSTSFQDVLGAVVIFTVLSYTAMLLVGAPLFLLLRHFGWVSIRACAAGGGIAGLLFAGIFSTHDAFSNGLLPTLMQYGSALTASTVGGVAAGLLFAHLRSAAI